LTARGREIHRRSNDFYRCEDEHSQQARVAYSTHIRFGAQR
jgi:hypothetical protein